MMDVVDIVFKIASEFNLRKLGFNFGFTANVTFLFNKFY